MSRVGRRPSTTQDHITDVALDLFTTRGFDEVSVDDVAKAAGIARRTLFRYYPSKNAIPWGDFDSHLNLMRELLAEGDQRGDIAAALRTALLAFNRFDDEERHRQRMHLILGTDALQAHSMTMYAGWRAVVAEYVGRRRGEVPGGLVPQTTAWTLLGVALTAYGQWLADETISLEQALADSFDVVGAGLHTL